VTTPTPHPSTPGLRTPAQRLAQAERLLAESREQLAALTRNPSCHWVDAQNAYGTIGRIVMFLSAEQAQREAA
jgi:hypothetical protein